MSRPSFAYVFERFPSFVQTFCLREVQEMIRQGMDPMIFSIRPAEPHATSRFPDEITRRVQYLPAYETLRDAVRALRARHALSSEIWSRFQNWSGGDKTRLYEAAWIGHQLRQNGVRHVHVHFAGIAARTAWWMRRFFGISYSFTGHANDLFCEETAPVTLADLVQDARFVATVSDFSRRWLAGRFPAHARKVFSVFNGIDVAQFHRATPAVPPLILSVGRYIEKKGFTDLIEACRLLDQAGISFHCRIVGTGPLEEVLRTQTAQAGLNGKVEITGPRSEKEIIALLAQAEIFALACTTEAGGGMDNLPTVIMEAMAAALPVVSTPVAGVPEMVTDGVTGLLVPERDPAALAHALQKLLASKLLREQMGASGRDAAQRLFAVEVTARQLKRLLVRKGRARLNLRALRFDPGLAPARLGRLVAW